VVGELVVVLSLIVLSLIVLIEWRVGRFGVDFEYKVDGFGGGFGGALPRL
jgi:hypothetical protein